MASVDGALFLNPEGEVHAFGCLLDGDPSSGENRARGSRYNSAIRYTEMHEGTAVLVGSSDGGVTLIWEGQQIYPTDEFVPPHQVTDGSYDTRVYSIDELRAIRAEAGLPN